mgnify:CR=1 FL=1
MKLKKIVTLVSSAILAFSLVGCSIEGEESSAGSDGAVVGNGSIGFSVSTLNNPFFVTLSQGAKDKAKDLAARFIKNFAKYEGNAAGKALVSAGPQA